MAGNLDRKGKISPMVKIFSDFKHLAHEYYSGRTFVAFDTETTGLHPLEEHVIEIGAVKFNCNGLIGKPFNMLIKPPVPVSRFITDLTHITNEMLEGCPAMQNVLPDFLNYIESEETILIGHNVPFDIQFMDAELSRCKMKGIKNRSMDTLQLARWAYPHLSYLGEKGVYKLQSLASRYNIKVEAAHRACDDARVCKELFKLIIRDTLSSQKNYLAESESPSFFTGTLF